ncbi:MAG TPA: double zinc ribbon domain-containing protein [Opitutaceae bacterium]|nr:double zinc ribbon domain-containing protein [Opitutaceae bacterium]
MKTPAATARVHRTAVRLLHDLGDVVFPPLCVHCQTLVEYSSGPALRHLCAKCASQLELVGPPHCTTCGHPFYGEVAGERLCPHCVGLDPAFDEGRTTVLFKGPARSLVIELKYHRGLHVLHDIEALFRRNEHITGFVHDATLVPVPLHSRKARERGYNQAELLAEALARAADGTARVEGLLRRVVDTETQTAFDRRTRIRNLKNAFALAPRANLNPASRYILVDDVFTTGSTLNSCARVLRRAGALKLGVVTFGHG